MKGVLGATVALAMLAILISSAQATIKIEIAEVQNGFAFVKGNGAERRAQITWEGNAVTTANNTNGGFSFNGAVPSDCIGSLSDGVGTINVQLLDCTPTSAAPAPVPKTGQTASIATGDDGDLEKGVASPNPRFTDNGNGTIMDNLTGLTWLKNASCLGQQTWANALAAANVLASPNVACGPRRWQRSGGLAAAEHKRASQPSRLRDVQSGVASGPSFHECGCCVRLLVVYYRRQQFGRRMGRGLRRWLRGLRR
jgi:hypothetical protein